MENTVPEEFKWWDTVSRWRPILPENLVPLLFNEKELNAEDNRRCEQLFDLAESQYEKESYKEAIDNLTELLKKDQVDMASWILLGYCYIELGLIREAWRSFKFGWYFDRFDSELLQAMAQLLFELKDFQLGRYIVWDWLLVEESDESIHEINKYISDYCEALKLEESSERKLIDKYHKWLDDNDEDEVELFECPIEKLEEILEQFDPGPDNPEPVEPALLMDLDFEALKCRCRVCNFPLPWDAPYCFGCGVAHIYQDTEEEHEYNG